MMIATNFGIYEFGRVNQRRLPETPDDAEMQIRARRRMDLVKLMDRTAAWMTKEGDRPRRIFATPDWDWPFRIYVSAEEAQTIMWNLVATIHYEFFKQDAEDEKLHDVLNNMWGNTLRLGPRLAPRRRSR